MNKKQFAARFSLEDWNSLCAHADFTSAIEAEEFDAAATIAHRILTAVPAASSEHTHLLGRFNAITESYLPLARAELAKWQAHPNAPKAVKRAEKNIERLESEAAVLQSKISRN